MTARSHNLIQLTTGQVTSRTIEDYDRGRPHIGARRLRSFCYAPYLSMDFDATGAVRLCNHSHNVVAQVSDDISMIDVWRGAAYAAYRTQMSRYVVDAGNCRHCVMQLEAGETTNVFAVQQFDHSAGDDPVPPYPKRLIFRLNNTCNLACIMCDGQTSSRIRRERDGLPPAPSQYGERFFADMEHMLPHAEHVEFYGGEPFLVKEHDRLFDIMERVGASCTIYINTNGVSLTRRARERLETLNFRTIAVSMDAVSSELHGAIRFGLRTDVFRRNLDYFLSLRERRGVDVMLNVTEHRKNWFELPEIFRFAENHRLPLHINTCIHPHNVTLYTLPTSDLAYVFDYLQRAGQRLKKDYSEFGNAESYEFLLSLAHSELKRRTPHWRPELTRFNIAGDGELGAPIVGCSPFDDPQFVVSEAGRLAELASPGAARVVLGAMLCRCEQQSDGSAWSSASDQLRTIIADLPGHQAP